MSQIKIVVTEPWDFESESGKNIIKGSIIKKDKEFILVKSDYILTSHGIISLIIKLISRNKKIRLHQL